MTDQKEIVQYLRAIVAELRAARAQKEEELWWRFHCDFAGQERATQWAKRKAEADAASDKALEEEK